MAGQARAVLAFGSDDPADLLENAVAVTRYLSESAVHLHAEGPDTGLSETGAQGLILILGTIENTISQAINKLC